jgi:hypothetical protein
MQGREWNASRPAFHIPASSALTRRRYKRSHVARVYDRRTSLSSAGVFASSDQSGRAARKAKARLQTTGHFSLFGTTKHLVHSFFLMPKRFSPALAILVCLLGWAIASQLWSALSWGHESFQLTEWLINYSGGFVRRGLPGWLVGLLADATGIQANHLVIGFSAICYGTLLIWFLRRSTRTFPAILILSCIVMGFPAYQDSIVRKDCLGLLFLLACLNLERSRMPRHFTIPAMNLTAIAAILCHEAFAFYGLPALVLFGSRDGKSFDVSTGLRRLLSLLPAAICFLCVTRLHGTPAIAEAVNDSWTPLWRILNPADPSIEHASAAIQALGWDSKKGTSLAITMLTSGFYQPVAWVGVFAISFVLFLLFTGRNEERSLEVRIRVTALLIAQFVFISPLFILGFDYGRWLFLWLASTVMLDTERYAPPRWLESCVARLFAAARIDLLLRRVPVRDWYLLFFGVPVCWNLFNFLTASPLGRHVHRIWSSMP